MSGRSRQRGGVRSPREDPLSSFPEGAQRILAAAGRLLASRGYESVTLEKVAAEAGANKASIRYYFGNKAGLLAALVDVLMHEEFASAAVKLPALPEGERLHAAMEAKRRLVLSADEFRGFFEILPHAIRTPELRDRIALLYTWWYQQNLRWLGFEGESVQDKTLIGVGRLMSAVVDGLSVQEGLDPAAFDPEQPIATFELLLEASMPDLRGLAGGSGHGGDGTMVRSAAPAPAALTPAAAMAATTSAAPAMAAAAPTAAPSDVGALAPPVAASDVGTLWPPAPDGGPPLPDEAAPDPATLVPVEDPLARMPTGQRILAAARCLLAEGGNGAITLERTAAAAGVNKATVRYNFGNKAGLVGSLVASMLREEFVKGLAAAPPIPDEDRTRALVEGKRSVILATDSFPGFFDILPHAFRDEQLRRHLAASYPWWAEQNLRLLGLEGPGTGERHPMVEGLGRLISAISDGLSIQAGLMGEDVDLDVPLGALERLLRRALPRLEELAPAATTVAGSTRLGGTTD